MIFMDNSFRFWWVNYWKSPNISDKLEEEFAMTDNTENLVLEILRQLRGDMTSLRSEVRDGFNRVEIRLGYVEQSLAGNLAVSASDRD